MKNKAKNLFILKKSYNFANKVSDYADRQTNI